MVAERLCFPKPSGFFDSHPESELICSAGVNGQPEHSLAFLCGDISANKRLMLFSL